MKKKKTYIGGKYKTIDEFKEASKTLLLKDIDFGEPGVEKNIYKVYISYLFTFQYAVCNISPFLVSIV